jgi:hypothetical protein
MGEVMWHTPENPKGARATVEEATNVSIDAGYHTSATEHSRERLTPSLPESATAIPRGGVLLAPLDVVRGESYNKKGVRCEPGKAKSVASAMSFNVTSVEALRCPVMSLSIDDEAPEKSIGESSGRDSGALSPASLYEARSAAEAVASFLDPQGTPKATTQANSEQPPMRRRRYQRRNSFVIHRKRSRSLHEGDRDHAVASLASNTVTGDGEALEGRSECKPKFDLSTARSQSDGTLMSVTSPPRTIESGMALHRLSLPWKRKKRDTSARL